MAEDFDLASLATYLHLTPQQVDRLASRGKIPGRKLGGEWKFSEAEIHHWMEERMGLLEDDELQKMEVSLAATSENPDVEIPLREMLSPETIAYPLEARTKNAVITKVCELATATGMLWDAEKMAEAVRAREQLQTTAMDNGVALLHPRRPMEGILGQAVMALGRVDNGIPFGGSRSLTDTFFLICSVTDRGHLRTLARLSRLLMAEGFLDGLREQPDAKAIYNYICDAEDELA
ncbi:MAG: PTS sugar transporter subunit IIA [Pirellulaceae bacterium]